VQQQEVEGRVRLLGEALLQDVPQRPSAQRRAEAFVQPEALPREPPDAQRKGRQAEAGELNEKPARNRKADVAGARD
jgi:hypothetical protein